MKLDISGNNIGIEGATAILAAVKINNSLHSVKLPDEFRSVQEEIDRILLPRKQGNSHPMKPLPDQERRHWIMDLMQ